MSNFPNQIDDDVSIPRVEDNIVEIGSEAINALRDAVFNIEEEIGTSASGTSGSISQRFNVSINPDGTIKPSALTGLGLVTLPITDVQISSSASIQESKLNLQHSTQSLYNLILTLSNSVDILNDFISIIGVKVDPHINGTSYRHKLSHIDVDSSPLFLNKKSILRNTTNSNTLLKDINDDFVYHEKSDGTSIGTVPPDGYGHVASGIFINTNNFATIPQSTNNLQKFSEFVDSSNSLLIGTRLQTLYSNGIPRTSRSFVLPADGYGEFGQSIIPFTSATTYLTYNSTQPVDNIDNGDDVILFTPSSNSLSDNSFDSKFSQVKSGDIVTINYNNSNSSINNFIVSYVIDSVKAIYSPSKVYAVRINGKNLFNTDNALARIDRPLFNENKYGVLSVSQANHEISDVYSSLIVSNPRSAAVLGIGFNPLKLDKDHYNLYLVLYPTGNPLEKVYQLFAVDITGNQGVTQGSYTLDSIVASTNDAFRKNGFNYRFVAFQYQGEFGIMLADHYNNASFSIISGDIDNNGNYTSSSLLSYPKNVIDNYNDIDPLGFGVSGSNVASPLYSSTYSTPEKAQIPTRIFVPLKRNFYYVNGKEKDLIKKSDNTFSDTYGDGYWPATITKRTQYSNRIEVEYTVNLDLRSSGLKEGKTIVIQPEFSITGFSTYNPIDYGRFVIKTISFDDCSSYNPKTKIIVYDGIHGTGNSPYASSENIVVRLYFSDDSISFDNGSISDALSLTPYKRYFEIFVDGTDDQSGRTFTHERARFLLSSNDIEKINFYKVSNKLKGYKSGNSRFIKLNISSYDLNSGIFSGYLSKIDNTHQGAISYGKKGEIIRFYDETGIDYIDFIFNINDNISTFSTQSIAIQLFPSLELDEEVFAIGSCQLSDFDKKVSYVRDIRQFGNVSEKQLSSSAIDFITSGDKEIHQNGVIRGFDIISTNNNLTNNIQINGGTALVSGKLVNINNSVLSVPVLKEYYLSNDYSKINWLLCINNKNEYQFIALTDNYTGTPNNPNRVIVAKNPFNSITYNIESRKFSDIVNNRKDLTILYFITTEVLGSGGGTTISVSYKDSRKFAFEIDASTTPILTENNRQGNFYNITSLDNWLTYNSNYYNTSKIRGNIIISSATSLSYTNKVIFVGEGLAKFTINNSLTISNIDFENINFEINSGGSFTVSANSTFTNCTITNNGGTFTLSTNEIFKNCTINSNTSLSGSISFGNTITFDNSVVLFNAANNFSFGTGLLINKSTITSNKQITLNSSTSIINSSIELSSEKGFVLNGNDIIIKDNNFSYTFIPSGSPYNINDLINSSSALIYSSTTSSGTSRKNISIKNNKFDNLNDSRYPFISFEVSDVNGFLQNISVSRNEFVTRSDSNDDIRSVINFSDNVGNSSNAVNGPILIDVIIDGNICNKKQMISITAKTTISNSTIENAFGTIGCRISNNICGTIGFITQEKIVSNSINTSSVKDRNSSLIIDSNNCIFMYPPNEVGLYALRPSFYVGYTGLSSGDVIVKNNKLSWFTNNLTGKSLFDGNIFKSYDYLFLDNNTLFSYSTTGNANSTALKIIGNNYTANTIISNNTFDLGTINGATYYRYNCDLDISGQSIINGNSFGEIKDGSASLMKIEKESIITNNFFYRNNNSISSYINLYGSYNNTITDNFFDSSTVDGASNEILVSGDLSKSIYERNKNQIGYTMIPIGNFEIVYNDLYFRNTGENNTLMGSDSLLKTTIAYKPDATVFPRQINFTGNIDNFLPENVQILKILIGMGGDGSIHTIGFGILNNFQTKIKKYNSSFTDSNPDLSFANVRTEPSIPTLYSGPTTDITLNISTFLSDTLYNVFDLSSDNLFTVKESSLIIKSKLIITPESNTAPGFVSPTVTLSPVIIRYRW